MKTYMMELPELAANCNTALDLYLQTLLIEKVLTEEQYKLSMQYRITITEPNGWGEVWNKFWKRSEQPTGKNYVRFDIVKVV